MYRNVGEIDQKTVLRGLNGWGLFPQTEDGVVAAVGLMAGEHAPAAAQGVGWTEGNIGFIAAASEKAWGESPLGVTPMRAYFSVYLSDDIDSNIYYSAVVDEGELFDVILSDDGEIIGNIYRQELKGDSEEFSESDADDLQYSLSIITESGMIGRSYFAYSPESPVASKVLPFYTAALAGLTKTLSSQPEFQAAISDFEAGQSIRKALEIILVNNKTDNEAVDWYNPVKGMPKWKVFLPYTEDGFTNTLYQKVTEHPTSVIESMLYQANGNILPWLGKSMKFLVRPDLDDIRLTTYSPILVSIEPAASRVLSLMVAEPTDETRDIELDGLKVSIHYGSEEQPAFYKGREVTIFSFRVVAIQEDIDLMVTFDYISHNQTDVYEKDVVSIMRNLVVSLQGVTV